MSLRESEDTQKKVASLGSNARTMKLPERIEKAIEQYGMAAYRQEEVTAQANVLRSAILAALDEARDGALEKAAHVCDNASTILFAEQMHRNHGSDTAIKIGSAIRALKSKRRA